MTRSECYAALRRGVRSPVRAALVLPVVAGAVLTTSAGAGGGAAVAEPGARAGGVRTTLAVAGNGILRSDGASSTAIGPGAGGDPSAAPEPTAGACEEDGARVVIGDGDDAEPVFDPGTSLRIAGSAWCVDGRLAQGERTLHLRLVAVGGYAFREEALLPVTFSDGVFDASIRIDDLLSGREPGAYYVSATVDSRFYVGTNQFRIAEPAAAPVDGSASAPAVEPPAEATGDAPVPPTDPSAQPSAEPVPEPPPSTAPDPVDAPEPTTPTTAPLAEADSEPTDGPVPTPSPGPTDAPATPAPDSTASTAASEPATPTTTASPAEPVPEPTPEASASETGSGEESPGPPDGPGSETTPAASPIATSRPETSRPDEGNPRGGRLPSPGSDGAADDPGERSAAPTMAPPSEPSEPGSASASDAEAGRGRPSERPTAPVKDASELDASNAGSLSGTRRGNVVTLILPSDKAEKDDWVAVFLFPEETTPGWTQVDADNSVSIDVSDLAAGTYQLAVCDRESRLLGWAQLEITTAAGSTSEPARMTVGTATAHGSSALGRDDWMLVSAGGLLLVGAASFLVLARPALAGRRR